MLPEDVAGRWPDLVARLDAADAVARWARTESALSGIDSVARLSDLTALGQDPMRADALLGALVRTAAVDGGDDVDAALVVLHLLGDGLRALVDRLADLGGGDRLGHLLAGQLMIQIRAFPWRRRVHAYAANLLLDTKLAVMRELGFRRGRRGPESPHEALGSAWWWAEACLDTAGDSEDPLTELLELLTWATRTGAADPTDMRLLWQLQASRGYGEQACTQVAHAWGISNRTVRRRSGRALAALRTAVPAYTAACTAA